MVVTLVAVAVTAGEPYVAGQPPLANVVGTDEAEKTALVAGTLTVSVLPPPLAPLATVAPL